MTALVLSVDQPYASLIIAGIKRFETRPGPPNGDMRPQGVRGLPGAAVNRGDRLLIASTTRKPRGFFPCTYKDNALDPDCPVNRKTWHLPGGTEIPWFPLDLPLGCILGAVTVTDAYPIVDTTSTWPSRGSFITEFPHDGDLPHQQGGLWLTGPNDSHGGSPTRIEDQRPLGDWSPGRWAWALADPTPTTDECPWCDGWGHPVTQAPGPNWCPVCDGYASCGPVPVVGRQGVWRWNGTVKP